MSTTMFYDMFHLGLPVAEIVRPVFIYAFLFVGLRLAELVTKAEIELAARHQGFDSLAEVEAAVLDPSGAINFARRVPSPGGARHDEIMRQLRLIQEQLAART